MNLYSWWRNQIYFFFGGGAFYIYIIFIFGEGAFLLYYIGVTGHFFYIQYIFVRKILALKHSHVFRGYPFNITDIQGQLNLVRNPKSLLASV